MTKYYIAYLDNVPFTRSTANRTYTHVVVSRSNIAQRRLRMEERARKRWGSDYRYVRECADGKHPVKVIPQEGFNVASGMADPQKYAEYVAECAFLQSDRVANAQAWLDKGEEGLVAEDLAWFDERVAKATNISADGLDFLREAGWCGRLDLAVALAARSGRAVILEARQVGKPVKAKR